MPRAIWDRRPVTRALFVVLVWSPLAADAEPPQARYGPIPDNVWSYMQGRSWHSDLPCAQRDDLVLMHIPCRDFLGETQMNQMVLASKVATQVAAILAEIYSSGKFRIYQMRLIDEFDGDDDKSIAANNTSGFN